MALVQSTETRMVLHDPKGIKLGSGKALTGDQYNFIKKQQRSTQNFWDSKWAFPTGLAILGLLDEIVPTEGEMMTEGCACVPGASHSHTSSCEHIN